MKNKLKRKNQHGFTLVEIIVVIVILAVLSAMVLPRFIAQSERAVLAEAQNMLGALRRAQNLRVDSGISTTADAFAAGALGGTVASVVAKRSALGFSEDIESVRWDYACTTSDCSAVRFVSGAAVPADTLTMTLSTGVLTCGSGKYDLVDSADASKGCKLK